MAKKTRDLEAVYDSKSPAEARGVYDAWAATYDAENLAKGFRLPWLAAAYLARHLPTGAGPVLDACCGTGLVGETLALLGYAPITGCDLSPEMMTRAATWNAYAGFDVADLGARLAYADDRFAGFTCIGSFGPGHAPPRSLRELVRVTRPGGIGVFNLREDTFRDQGFDTEMAAIEAAGLWRLRERSPAFRPYLVGEPDLICRIYAVEVV